MRPRILSRVSVSPRKPFTWAQPVMPGRTLWPHHSSFDQFAVEPRCAPPRAESLTTRADDAHLRPCSTLMNRGSSSIEVCRISAPSGVTRGSPRLACTMWCCRRSPSSSGTCRPGFRRHPALMQRRCLKMIEPGELSMVTAMASNSCQQRRDHCRQGFFDERGQHDVAGDRLTTPISSAPRNPWGSRAA